MSPDAVFALANPVAILGWLALAAFPFRRWANWWLCALAIPGLLALAYIAALLAALPWPEGAGFGSLAAVRALFTSPWALLAGWLHYLAFDLFLGAWMARRAQTEGWSRWRLLPALPPTFLFGPAGLLVFLALRAARPAVAR